MLMLACYMERNSLVKPLVASDATTAVLNRGKIGFMGNNKQGQHFIRQWRKKRGVSLRKLAARLEVEPGGEPLVSYASLSRIESGDQPFSEPILNAIAAALDVPRVMLLEMDPEKEGHIIDLLNKMDGRTRAQAIRMLELMAQSSAA
jgi:transcriptional regulator with XRE-family HTH domain